MIVESDLNTIKISVFPIFPCQSYVIQEIPQIIYQQKCLICSDEIETFVKLFLSIFHI